MTTLEGIFVQNLYQAVLFRQPSQAEIDAAVADLTLGTKTRDNIRAELVNGAEYTNNVAAVVRLYEGILGRAPDTAGIQFWVNSLNSALEGLAVGTEAFNEARKSVLIEISNQFAASAEASSLEVGNPDNTAFVNAVYQGVLGRAPDAGGQAFWVGQLEGGASRGDMIQAFAQSAENIAQEIAYTIGYGFLRAFDNAQPTDAQLEAFLNTATTQEILASAKDVGATSNAPQGPGTVNDVGGQTGQTLNLTQNLDVLTGTNLDDTFSSAAGTLNSFDTLNGGAGNDTLFANFTNPGLVSPTVTGIETINLTDAGTAPNLVFSFLNVTGVQNVNVTASTAGAATTTLQDLPSMGIAYSASNFTTAGGGLTLAQLDASGTADEATITLSRFGNAANPQAIFLAGYETANLITKSLPSDLSDGAVAGQGIGAASLKTINISGDQAIQLDVDNPATSLTTVDASALTAGLTLNVFNNTNVTVKGGSANDRILIANLNANDTIDGGEGTDTLVGQNATAGAVAITGGSVTNVETFEAQQTNAGGALTVTAGAIGATGLSVTNATGNVTFNSVTAGTPLTVATAGGAADAGTIAYNLANTIGTSDSVSVTLDAANVPVATPPAEQNIILTINGIETLDLGSVNTKANGSTNELTTLNQTTLKTINITGDTNLDITAAVGAQTINAGGFTGGLDITAIGAGTTVITSGSGNDNFTFTAGSLAAGDNVNGGDGVDTLALTDQGSVAGVTISNIESIRINNTNGADDTLTMSQLGNISSIIVNGTGASVTTLASLADNATISVIGGNAGNTLTGTLANDTLSNTANLVVTDNNPAAVSNIQVGTLNLKQIETVNVTLTDTLTTTTTNLNAATSLTATGGGNLTLGGVTVGSQFTLDASATTGTNNVTTAGGLTNLVYKGGTGNDTIDVDAQTLTSNIQDVNGGVGNDTFNIKTDGVNGGMTITDVETINIANVNTASSILGSGITSTGTTNVTVGASTANLTLGTAQSPLGAGVVGVNASGAGAVTVNAAYSVAANHQVQTAGPGAGTGTITFNAGTTNTITFGATTAANTALTVVGFGADDRINLPGAGTINLLTAGSPLDGTGGNGPGIAIVNDSFGNTQIRYSADADNNATDAGDFIITLQGVELAGQLTANNFIA